MASVSARRALESRTSARLPNATSRPRRPPSPTRIKRMVTPEVEQLRPVDTLNPVDSTDAETGEHLDDRSSSLSDPDDDIEESEELSRLGHDANGGDSLHIQQSLEVDSEAETERLEHTPQKLRKHADTLAFTPSKLSQAATADDELSEPPSPLPAGTGAASSTSTIANAGLKRKRSDTADSSLSSAESDIGESPRKRSHEMTADDQLRREEAVEDAEIVEESAQPLEDTPMLDEIRDTPPVATKGPKGRRGRQKGKKQKEPADDAAAEASEEKVEPVEEPVDEDPAKAEELRKLKLEASGLYDSVAKTFLSFREKLYNERLAAMTAELELLSQPECVHPEYMRQVACVDAKLRKQTREAHAFYKYKLKSIHERTLGERSQLHSQYFQQVRNKREDILYALGEQWYAIQKERRQGNESDIGDAQVYLFDPKRSTHLKQQAKYNLEVSILSGMAKHVGFPAAPEMHGVEDERRDEDMRQMKISKPAAQPIVHTRPLLFSAGSSAAACAAAQITQKERLAHEQYLEQNPWARPQAPILAHGTPGISHTPDWADSAASKHIRQAHLGARNSSPFMTPLSQKTHLHAEQLHPSSGAGTIAVNSDDIGSAEAPIPSSVAAAPPTVDRMSFFQRQLASGGHQTSPLAFPKLRENGTTTTADTNPPPGHRNISGLSNASTIDAPLEHQHQQGAIATASAEERYGKHFQHSSSLPVDTSSGRKTFPINQFHFPLESGEQRREVFANAGFRPQAGAFGTPTPVPGLHAPPPSTGAGS